RLGLPTALPGGLKPGALLARMRLDKKADAGGLRFILWTAPGEARIVAPVPEDAVLRTLEAGASGGSRPGGCTGSQPDPSLPSSHGSRLPSEVPDGHASLRSQIPWIPACAGMTGGTLQCGHATVDAATPRRRRSSPLRPAHAPARPARRLDAGARERPHRRP